MASVSNSDIRIHPSVDNGVKQGRADFAGGTLDVQMRDRSGEGRDHRTGRA